MAEPAEAHRRLQAGITALRAVADSGLSSDDELLSVLTVAEGVARQLDQLTVSTIADLQRRGVFAERGYEKPADALSDLLGWEGFEARRRVVAAEQACARVGLDGSVSQARLPATGQAFTTGRARLRHVEVIAALMGSATAGRLDEGQRVGAEQQLAAKTGEYSPTQLRKWGTTLLERLDQDGAEPDDRPREPVDELHLRPHRDGRGGTLTGRFDDPAKFAAIASLVDAKAKPLDADDRRGPARRQAEALADACGWVLDHGDHNVAPQAGGRRPQVNVHIDLRDLQAQARAAMLDFGGRLSPQALRMLACDAAVVPIVFNGAGQPLDVGRSTRVVPEGLRRAVTARDRGCAHPGCDRPPSWTEIHHIHEWEHGGPTRLDNLVMLCRVHHRLIHHSGWVVRIRGGLPDFIPPRWVVTGQVVDHP